MGKLTFHKVGAVTKGHIGVEDAVVALRKHGWAVCAVELNICANALPQVRLVMNYLTPTGSDGKKLPTQAGVGVHEFLQAWQKPME